MGHLSQNGPKLLRSWEDRGQKSGCKEHRRTFASLLPNKGVTPLTSAVHVYDKLGPTVMVWVPLGTCCLVVGVPPSDAGASQDHEVDLSPGVAKTLVGADGTVTGPTAVTVNPQFTPANVADQVGACGQNAFGLLGFVPGTEQREVQAAPSSMRRSA